MDKSEEERMLRIIETRQATLWPGCIRLSRGIDRFDEIDTWLRENVGQPGAEWSVFMTRNGLEYRFKNPAHKAHFWMVWG